MTNIIRISAAIVNLLLALLLTRIGGSGGAAATTTSPKHAHVIVIMADDLGFNDVSFHGSNQFVTPNIDALAYQGVILNRHYTPPLCSPSRSAFFTGKSPFHTGLQHLVILPDEPWGLGLKYKIMPQYFKEAGYHTHLVGKWHLGFYKKVHTPLFRGFDSFFGYLGPHIDYYDHSSLFLDKPYVRALDLRSNLTPNRTVSGLYATELFTSAALEVIDRHPVNESLFLVVNHKAPHAGNEGHELQAPQEEIDKFAYIRDPKRRVLAAMVSILDRGIGKLIVRLKERDMLQNSVILFCSDNGAPSVDFLANSGSNYPLRGQKDTPFEGGIRTPAILWSPRIAKPHRVSNELFSMTDWLPTLLSAAGVEAEFKEIDGVDQWNFLSTGETNSSVREIPVNIDEKESHEYSILINGTYKLINGTTFDGKFDKWLGAIGDEISPLNYEATIHGNSVFQALGNADVNFPSLRKAATTSCKTHEKPRPCFPVVAPCLFDIFADPCEQDNLATDKPEVVEMMMARLNELFKGRVPMQNAKPDPKADPKYFNRTWTWWVESTEADFKLLRVPRELSFLDGANESYFYHWFVLGFFTLIIIFLGMYVILMIPKIQRSKKFPDFHLRFIQSN